MEFAVSLSQYSDILGVFLYKVAYTRKVNV